MENDFKSARREKARKMYRPDKIRFLLIAEAPPRKESGRFFYYEDVDRGDSLFLETMKVLYRTEYKKCKDTKTVRLRKSDFLKRFKSDGFYLIDAVDKPLEDSKRSKKLKCIQESLPSLLEKLKDCTDDDTKIILISKTVYDVCVNDLKESGFNVINEDSIDFPGFGHQTEFRKEFEALLKKYGQACDLA